ncbi:MAG: lytic transglycosylase domain-containing protein, partial [Caulobacteraceae bacterium]
MSLKIFRTGLAAGAAIAAASVAEAQTTGPATPIPYTSLRDAAPTPYPSTSAYVPPAYAPPAYAPPSPFAQSGAAYGQSLSPSDAQNLLTALAAARQGDGGRIRASMAGLYDPLARKIALWALADAGPDSLSDAEANQVRLDLAGWPSPDRRQIADAQRAGVAVAEAEFEAGWTALTKLRNPQGADQHFARLQTLGRSPLTQSRAFYWRGRATEAMGDPVGAQLFYAQAARYYTTFYGQLAAAKAGQAMITLGRDPPVTPADRSAFEAGDPIRAAKILAQIGAKDTFKSLVIGLSDMLPTAAEEAMLVDFVRGWGDQSLAMRVVRNAATRDLILPERGYPIRATPVAYGAPEAPFVLGIVRQESSFDPMARSGAGARGMMQLMPATAQSVARGLGLGYGDLEDPVYNMTLGSAFLGQLVNQFGGSYVMAAAA